MGKVILTPGDARHLLAEAKAIARGESTEMPAVEHLVALLAEIERLTPCPHCYKGVVYEGKVQPCDCEAGRRIAERIGR